MKLLWTLVKVALVLVLVIPVAMIVLGVTLGLFGALLGLAFAVLRIAVFALIAYGIFKLGVRLFRGPEREPVVKNLDSLPPPKPDPHYEAAMRELDQELGTSRN